MIGATPQASNQTEFKVWAPAAKRVAVEVSCQFHDLAPLETGYYGKTIEAVKPGDRYRFQIDNGRPFPDPASRFQPEGVHGPSEVVDPNRFQWQADDWKGIARDDLVIYEIHVGTFTPEGTFRGVLNRLDELIELGVTALEIMPVAQAPGRWNWGYDAVNLFAPSHLYGHPDDFKHLVDTCHQKGIAVILDVVYNHIGPEGNYLANFGPYFSKGHTTPWGEAFNFDETHSKEVRQYIRDNVTYWIEEFHLDGLRLDAIRLMFDNSEISIVEDIANDVAELRKKTGRHLHLIGESCVYDPGLIQSGYDAVWSDEIPHAILSIVVNQEVVAEREYKGFDDLLKCLHKGYLYQWEDGEISRCHSGDRGHIEHIIQGLQTHDQVGNHPLGLRLSALSSPESQRVAAALTLLYPSIPFIFMGEEFATPSPFCFFVDFGDERLREGVISGRKRDYEHHNWSEFISPLDEETFLRSKLPPHSEGDELTLKWYRTLLQIRKEWKEEGIFDAKEMIIEFDPAFQVVTLRYPKAWVAVRLGPETGQSEDFELKGEVLLHSSQVIPDISKLGPNQAAIGRATD
ncbi:MAG: malto-oligosyltrehalose trehalohydrolase [Verrucomicrobiales bacterium]|nr:malto-oligosyltrehalose trehalohydrolase [Verrucomicrobiales bacterium]